MNYRNQFTRVKTAKGRKKSSTLWLQRQLNDPFVAQAKIDGYKSRAAYKLLEINQKFQLFFPGAKVVDLGAAPGGWSQVVAKLVNAKNAEQAANTVIAIDLLPMEPIAGVHTLQQDFYQPAAKETIIELLGDQLADVVISDMAANTTGHQQTDHLRTLDLCEQALDFALKILKPGGHFIAKLFRGGAEIELLTQVKQNFQQVKHFKPSSSRKNSTEMYLVALNKQ